MVGIAASVYLLVKGIIAFIEGNAANGVLLILLSAGAAALGVLAIKHIYHRKKDDGGNYADPGDTPPRPPRKTVNCPNCGAAAFVRGNMWECGWCGDFGAIRRQ